MASAFEKLQCDLSFWFASEEETIKVLEELWLTVEQTSQSDILDYIIKDSQWNTINIELKTRRNEKEAYDTTLIGANKLAEAYNSFYKKGVITLFLFKFTDGLYYLNPLTIAPDELAYKVVRWDRGKIDGKRGWLYYKTKHLKLINIKKC